MFADSQTMMLCSLRVLIRYQYYIRFIAKSKISQIWCIVGLKKGKIDALWDTFCPFFNSTMHQICDILLFLINLIATMYSFFVWKLTVLLRMTIKTTRAVLGFRGFGFRGVWNMLSFGMVVLDMSWLVFMYAVKKKKKKKDLSRTMEVDQRSGLC